MALFKKKTKKEKKESFGHTTKEAMRVGVPVEESAEPETRKAVLPQGEDPEAYRFVLSPHITEKATNGNALNKYTFKVAKGSNKIAVKKAIEKLYKVQVLSVHTQNMPAKTIQVGRYTGHKVGFKKAIITLKEGQKIEVV